jgi:hypothetical protein
MIYIVYREANTAVWVQPDCLAKHNFVAGYRHANQNMLFRPMLAIAVLYFTTQIFVGSVIHAIENIVYLVATN